MKATERRATGAARFLATLVLAACGNGPNVEEAAGEATPGVLPAGGADRPNPQPGNDRDGGDAAPGPRPVEGKVLDANDTPVPGATVAIDGVTAITDDLGAFRLMAPGGPYDVLVAGQAGTFTTAGREVTLYVGVTSSKPVVRMPREMVRRRTPNFDNYGGTVTGIATPIAEGVTGKVWIALPGSAASEFPPGSTSLQFYGTAVWPAATPTKTTSVHALFLKPQGNAFTAVGYGTALVTLTRDTTTDSLVGNLPLAPVPSATITGDLAPSAGATSTSCETLLDLGANRLVTGRHPIAGPGAVAFPQPSIAGSTIVIGCTSVLPGTPARFATLQYAGLAADAKLGTVALSTPGTAKPPAGAPGNVRRTASFELEGGGSAGKVRSFHFAQSLTTPTSQELSSWTVYTLGASAKLPDATSLGFPGPVAAVPVTAYIKERSKPDMDAMVGATSAINPALATPGEAWRQSTSTFADVTFVD